MHYEKTDDNADKSAEINLVQNEIGGGRITVEQIDTIEDSRSTRITISGLTQKTFEYFIDTYGHRFREINFWKCPLVKDLSKIENLANIESISYFWNQRAESLWDFSKNTKLKKFCFDDFTRMHDLSLISLSPALEELEFGDKVWSKYTVQSLQPLSKVKGLRRLVFSAKKIMDNRIEPLSHLTDLEELNFPINLFTTEKVAWLRARLPLCVKSATLVPFTRFDNPIQVGKKKIDTFITGKRKPSLDWNIDRKRIEKYEEAFNDLVKYYSANKQLEEPA